MFFFPSFPQGNACSVVQSNYMGFGTGIVPRGCGFTLQNRGSNFVIDNPEHLNVAAPRKRPYHTIIPALITHDVDDTLLASFGVMGGFMQPQGHVQVLLNLVAQGMTPQRALDAPRICLMEDGSVACEELLDPAVIEQLRALGHHCQVITGFRRTLFGRGQVILCERLDDGTVRLAGGSEPRADGCAMPAL